MGGFRVQLAEQVVQEWMAEGREMDAIFAADDNMAMGAIKALRQAGKSVPDDIAVVGFNDDLPSRYLSPALTTVYAPAEEVGRSAANTLLALMDGQPIHEAIVLPTHLIIRQSCGSLSVPQSVSLSAND